MLSSYQGTYMERDSRKAPSGKPYFKSWIGATDPKGSQRNPTSNSSTEPSQTSCSVQRVSFQFENKQKYSESIKECPRYGDVIGWFPERRIVQGDSHNLCCTRLDCIFGKGRVIAGWKKKTREPSSPVVLTILQSCGDKNGLWGHSVKMRGWHSGERENHREASSTFQHSAHFHS